MAASTISPRRLGFLVNVEYSLGPNESLVSFLLLKDNSTTQGLFVVLEITNVLEKDYHYEALVLYHDG